MKRSFLQQLLLYRYRYAIAYVLFFVLLATLLFTQLTSVPAGLSESEKQSVIKSASIALRADTNVIDLPYHLLQKASIRLLGLNEFAIKLPSLVLGLLSGIGIVLLLRRWFSQNVAIISALFIVTNVLFLASARSGTPDIMLIFFSTYILLFATLITQGAKGQFIWRTTFGTLIAASLYTPLSLYVIVSCLVAGILHPHARYVLKRYGGPRFVGALFLFVPLMLPLAIGIWHNWRIVYELLGLPSKLPDAASFADNLIRIADRLGGVTMPYIGEYVQPTFSVVSLALIGLGLLRALIDIHATRTYALLIWIAVIAPVVIISQTYLPILFVPSALLIAIGLQTLIREWYALFPYNPYARLFGLIPLLALISGVILFNYTTYFYGLRYSPATARAYSNDLRLLNGILAGRDITKQAVVIGVEPGDITFYRLIAPPGSNRTVVNAADVTAIPAKGSYIVTAKVPPISSLGESTQLTVNDRQYDALRWRTYVR